MAYAVKVTGEGVDMTKEVDEESALAILGILMGVQPAPVRTAGKRSAVAPSVGDGVGAASVSSDLTIGEFLADSKASNNPERIAAIAMYLRDYRGEPSVARTDLPALFQQAGEVPPKNPSRDMSKAVKKRLVAEDHNKPGHYRVTKTGERTVFGTES